MSETTLSKRARKKQAREAQAQGDPRPESASDAKKDGPSTPSSPAELDSEIRLREGINPFIDVVQKKVRNLTKRKTRLEALDAQGKDSSMPPLKPDQVEAVSFLPQVAAIITELNELIPLFKKLEQSENDFIISQQRKYKEELREAERAKEAAVKESYEKGVADARGETKIVTSFLRYASYLRELRGPSSHVEGESQAVENVLLGVYQGGDKALSVALKLAGASEEPVSEDSSFTYAHIKETVLKYDESMRAEVSESPSEQPNGSFVHVDQGAEHNQNGGAGYQIPLSEIATLDNSSYVKDSVTNDVDPSRHVDTSGLNFFQRSELETDAYPISPHGFPTQGISFLQESELGSHQPHEDYTKGERADQVNELANSPRLPPIQTLTETEGPPKVNLGVGTYAGAGTGEAGNAAAEKMLSKTPSSEGEKVQPTSDWAEEASPTTETAPALPEKKVEEEWTTQASRHSRHQSQQRGGRGGGQRGGRDGWRGGEGGRGGSRGGYRGGRGGERGASNGERRGSWRGSERGRGRGNNNTPSTAA